MFALDRRHDVAEPAGASGFERSNQRSMALDLALLSLDVEVGEITEEFIFDIEEGLATGGEVSTSFKAKRVGAGRPVEGFRGRSPPIHNHWILAPVPHSNTADIERVVVFATVIDTSKNQRRIANVELLQAIDDVLGERFSFKAGLIGATSTHLE